MRIVAKDKGEISIKNGKLFVNGVHDIKVQIPSQIQKSYPSLKKGEVFCVFDNQSTFFEDSIILGPIKQNDLEIVGKVFTIFKKNS